MIVATLPFTTGSIGITQSCPANIGFMKYGIPNDMLQVTELQNYLKNGQELDVDVTGTFDYKTENAVKDFQTKYMSDVLAPWGATEPSGIVNITTVKKINQLACGIPLALDTKDLQTLADYKVARAAGTLDQSDDASSATGVTDSNQVLGPVVAIDHLNDDGTVTDPQTASAADAVAGTSLVSRFWYFLKGLFK